MKKSFIAGSVAGASSLAVAVPLLAQMAGAASSGDVMFYKADRADMPAPSQECVQALAAQDAKMLSGIDAQAAAHKTALQAHQAALTAAASITDEAARKAAVLAADEAMHESMRSTMEANDPKADMDALKTACGDAFGFGMRMMGPGGPHMGKMMKMRGPGGPMLLEQLGMTKDELKAALDGGKTIEQIADEKGIELKEVFERRLFLKNGASAPASSSAASVQ